MTYIKPFWIYLNWVANAPDCRARLHYSNCKQCNNGTGKHENPSHGLNGVWAGPFNEIQYADEFVKNIVRNSSGAERCSFCKP